MELRVSGMKELFVTRLLTQDADGQIEFSGAELNLFPGNGFVSDQNESIVLAGGFPSVIPDAPFLLSPTLQANADLTDISEIGLEQIARAELVRAQKKLYRSYAVDVDSRIAVIASSAKSLRDFNDTFGGILAIESFLVKGHDPEFTTVTEMSLESASTSGVSLEYAVRAPLTSNKCTYCGACGLVCPEKCISANLDFDFEICTFCKKCEEICPHEAIEIHAFEYRSLKLPAVIVLDELEIEGAVQCNDVYKIEDFESYLKTLYPFQVDEIISVEKEICQYNANLNKGCKLCFESCSHDAISLVGGVRIDPLRCEECGDCLAVCPTGALKYERFSDKTFVDYIQASPAIEGKTVILADTSSLHSFWWHNRSQSFVNTQFLVCESTEFLSFFHFVYLYAQGAAKIVVTKSAEGGRILERGAKLANTVIASLFNGAQPILITQNLSDVDFVATQLGVEPMPVNDIWQNRRETQSEALAYLVAQGSLEPGFKGNHQTPFATINCNNERCTQCMSCINVCKIRAMRADETEMILSHKAASCVGCGLCVAVCPENALEISRNWQFRKEFFEEGVMAAGEPMNCLRCGKTFGTRKSYDRVMSILAAKESVDTSHFEYCEDCRVIRLFEENQQ